MSIIRRAMLAVPFALAAVSLAGITVASARGPGNYGVSGKEGGSNATYSGSAQLTKHGNDTWRLTWRIGNAVWTGFGIGDGKVISANFSGNGQSGVMLLIAKDDGSGYEAVWAYNGEKSVGGYENWSKR
jgi:hypothetical protein